MAELSGQLDRAVARVDAIAKGFTNGEVQKMFKIASLYAQTSGLSEVEAFNDIATIGSDANRLMNYGGRFTKSAANFQNGLRILRTFGNWFQDVTKGILAMEKVRGSYIRKDGMNKTMLNADSAIFNGENLRSVEKFMFEHLAQDESVNLSETDSEKLFGMDNNPVSHFFGLALNNAKTQMVAQIPPKERTLFFKAVNLFYPLAETGAEANSRPDERGVLPRNDVHFIFPHVLNHLGEISEMEKNGTLTLENVARLCFPELPKDGPVTFADVRALMKKIEDDVEKAVAEGKIYGVQVTPVYETLQETGCSVKEAIAAANGGERPPMAKYMSSGSLQLEAFNGTTTAGRNQLLTDLERPANYGRFGGKMNMIPDKDLSFNFYFPNEVSVATNSSDDGKRNINTVCNKIEQLCGGAHTQQASSVMMMVSQSGLSCLRGGLAPSKIESSEHSAIDFTLTRDAESGDVKIEYTSPKALPFTFNWTATVKTDGFVTSTPFHFEWKEGEGERIMA